MRVRIDNGPDTPPTFGEFLGLLSNQSVCNACDSDTPSAVVRVDNGGMFLRVVHPSRVTLLQE